MADWGYRVIAPDFLGRGFSDKRDGFDRSFQEQARMILALLAQLGIARIHVVGHDTGGAVALILGIDTRWVNGKNQVELPEERTSSVHINGSAPKQRSGPLPTKSECLD